MKRSTYNNKVTALPVLFGALLFITSNIFTPSPETSAPQITSHAPQLTLQTVGGEQRVHSTQPQTTWTF